MREIVRHSACESVQPITLCIRLRAIETRKLYNVLEILIVLYILNAVYPDNGVTTHGLYEESVVEEEGFAP
jgi:hypothetical protein